MGKYAKYVFLAAIAALGVAWFQGRHTEAAAENHAWNNIASELAHRPVTVRCQGFLGATVDVSAEAGFVRYDENGKPVSYTNLKYDVCKALARYPNDIKTAAFTCVERNTECDNRVFDDVQAVHVLAHESEHLGGQTSEAQAECNSLRTTAYVAMRLGSTRAQAAAVGQWYFLHIYPSLPDEYLAGNCAP